MHVRMYNPQTDADTIRSWLSAWGLSPDAVDSLPRWGAVVEAEQLRAACWLAEAEGGCAMIVNGIADRALEHSVRSDAFRLAAAAVCAEADQRGLALVGYTSRPAVVGTLQSLGFQALDEMSVTLVRVNGGV